MDFKLVLIWLLASAVLILAVPRIAPAQEPSPAVRRACDSDVRRLCPDQYRARDNAAIGVCMRQNAAMITLRCAAAWLAEHPGDKK